MAAGIARNAALNFAPPRWANGGLTFSLVLCPFVPRSTPIFRKNPQSASFYLEAQTLTW